MPASPARRLAPLALALGLLVGGCSSAPDRVTAPPPPPPATMEVGNWNVEWFGDATFGPADEARQQANVRAVLAGADVEIWGLQEIVSETAWHALVAGLPGYTGVLANDASVEGGARWYGPTEQKVALLVKNAAATVTGARIVLTGSDYDFGGRPPLEVSLRLAKGTAAAAPTLTVLVLHHKAFDDATSWGRRSRAAEALRHYLDVTHPTDRVMVIGDWNDLLVGSITAGQPSPFAGLVADSAHYVFPTRLLADAGVPSTAHYPTFIDHQLATNEQAALYVAGSVHTLRPALANYAETTTDHYPVVSTWRTGG